MQFVRFALSALLASLPTLGVCAQLLVANKGDSTLAFMDPNSGATIATIATGNAPHEVEVSSDGRLAFVSNYGEEAAGNTLSVIDVAARKELRRVDLGELSRPHGLVFSDGSLYFTSEASRRIGRYDPRAQRVDWTFDTAQSGTHMILAARDGARLYTSNIESNSVSIIARNASGGWTQQLVKVGAEPEGLALSADDRSLWSAHSGDGGVSIIDARNGRVMHTFDAKTRRSNRVKLTSDGHLALISDLGAGELAIFDTATYAERARLQLGREPSGILLAPNGAEAYVAVSGDRRIAVLDLRTLRVVRTIATGNGPDGMAWVP